MSTKKMKLLFENWRGYIEEDQYLDENDYLIEDEDEDGVERPTQQSHMADPHAGIADEILTMLGVPSDTDIDFPPTPAEPAALGPRRILRRGGQQAVEDAPTLRDLAKLGQTAGAIAGPLVRAPRASPEDGTVPPPQQSQKSPSPQDEIDKLKGFGSKFRKARELGMTKFKHKGKTFGTRLRKRKPKTVAAPTPTPTPELSPREKELKARTLAGIKRGHDAGTALKVAKMQMSRRAKAAQVRAGERAISRQLGPGGVMGVADAARKAGLRENRLNENKQTRRNPRKLKMRVKRLTKTAE